MLGNKLDAKLKEDVICELQWDPRVDETEIGVEVSNGVVTLTGNEQIQSTVSDGIVRLEGSVERLTQKLDAEADAERVQRSIESALERYAVREAKQIQASVKDGVVTLTGNVRSWRERRAVVGAAKGAKGVQSVQDHLRIGGD